MSAVELNAILPLLVLAGAATLTLLMAAFLRRPAVVAVVAATGLLSFVAAVLAQWPMEQVVVADMLSVDNFALLLWALMGLGTLAVLAFNHDFYRAAPAFSEETSGLFMLALLGACVLVASVHFASLFMGLELLSVCLFILIAWQCRSALSIEAGIKYLVLAGLATGFMLFGMALIFAAAGTLGFEALDQLGELPVARAWWQGGLALLLVGVVFKLSLVPFHFWTPDVYQGAPLPVTAFLAAISKVAVAGVLLRLIISLTPGQQDPLWQMLALLAGASMLAGNWLALLQDDMKRLLAYSSVAHMGYALAALLAGGALAAEALIFYLLFYLATTLVAFGVLVGCATDRASPRIADLRGLGRRRPLAALLLTLALLSLAGVPLTSGFIGKFYVLAAGASAGHWGLMGLVIAGSAIGLYYYLRVVLVLFAEDVEAPAAWSAPATMFCLCLLALSILGLGVLPESGMTLASSLARDLVPAPGLLR